MIHEIMMMPYMLGMLITAMVSLLWIKMTVTLFPGLSITRADAAIMAILISLFGPVGVLASLLGIALTASLKLLILALSKTDPDWWRKEL